LDNDDPTLQSDVQIDWFRQASPYIRQHRGTKVVIMLPGEFICEPYLESIVSDIALLVSLGIQPVLVHGARSQIKDALEQQSIASELCNGVRVTPHEHLEHIVNAVGATRYKLEAQLSCGMPNSAMHGSHLTVRSGNFVNAKPRGIVDGVDYQFTGTVRSIDYEGIQSLLTEQNVVLVSPLGYSLTGELFNVSFSEIAVAIATSIGADKIITYNDEGQIRDGDNNTYREMTLLQCKKFLVETQRHRKDNTYFSLQACHQACDKGVPRAHIISALENGALLKELFTLDGAGTMVYRDSYETIRRANIEDVTGIFNLIQPLENAGVLVKRSRERLENEIGHFTVMEKDQLVIGCAALYPDKDSRFGEIACVAIHPDYRGGGRARKLLVHIEKQAARQGLNTLFVLTTQTAHWFIEQGFSEISVDALPVSRQALYNMQRQSKVFKKSVSVRASTIDL